VPFTIQYQLATDNITELRYQSPNMQAIEAQDAISDAQKGRMRIGVILPINQDFLSNATITKLPNGEDVYRMQVATKSAEALTFHFSKFELGQHDKLFIFNQTGAEVFKFTSFDNQDNFATPLIGGETIILELVTQDISKIDFKLSEIGYTYRNTGKSNKRDFGDADPCEINVNCQEGTNWTNQRDAVVRILVKEGSNQFWCSGALINNVREDCTPYLLTAEHCGISATPNDINQWIFYFKYEAPGCSNPPSEGTLASQFLTGATLKARSNDNGGDNGSDFFLLELNNTPPASYNPYYAGWDANNVGATSGVSIHHPSGDIKKISTFTTTLTSTSWGSVAPNTHWSVTWASTTNGHGVTEVGSSGAPIFNQNKRIVGTLTGGSAFCTNPNSPDEYGKISYHWTNNGVTAANQLKPWLDPDNTNTLVLDGIAHPCNSSTNNITTDIELKIFPNPAQEWIQIEWNLPTISSQVTIYNTIGEQVAFYNSINNAEQLSIQQLSNGLYLMAIELEGKRVIRKFMVGN
jgi:hypothetical protein